MEKTGGRTDRVPMERLRSVVARGLGLVLGALAGIVVGLLLGIGIAMLTGVL